MVSGSHARADCDGAGVECSIARFGASCAAKLWHDADAPAAGGRRWRHCIQADNRRRAQQGRADGRWSAANGPAAEGACGCAADGATGCAAKTNTQGLRGDIRFPDWPLILRELLRPGEVIVRFNPQKVGGSELLHDARLMAMVFLANTHVVAVHRDESEAFCCWMMWLVCW